MKQELKVKLLTGVQDVVILFALELFEELIKGEFPLVCLVVVPAHPVSTYEIARNPRKGQGERSTV